MVRARSAAVGVGFSLLLLSACGDQVAGPGGTPTGPGPSADDPVELGGHWYVERDGDRDGTILTLGEGLFVWGDTCVGIGDWDAGDGHLVVTVDGGSGDCAGGGPDFGPPWLAAVTAYRIDGDTAQLLDASGDVVVTLQPGAEPTVPDTMSADYGAPVDRAALRERFPAAPGVPDGLVAADGDMLVGRWTPLRPEGPAVPPEAHVAFAADGAWTGSDGCNGTAGRWAVGEGGLLLSTHGPSTEIGCDNVPVGGMLREARAAALDGDELVLLAPDGAETGRFLRAGAPAPDDDDAGNGDAGDGDTTGDGTAGAAPEAGGLPSELIGTWRVEGPDDGATLTISDEVRLWGECVLMGDWRASREGLFVAGLFGRSGDCAEDGGLGPSWLHEVTHFAVDGQRRLLLAGGEVVATLTPGATPDVPSSMSPDLAVPIEVTDEIRAALDSATRPLPDDLVAPAAEQLLGRWTPLEPDGRPTTTPSFAAFHADGSWSGSDGCNGQGGRWVLGDAGAWVATSGAQTLIGCDGISATGIVAPAVRVGLDGEELVLIGRDGRETGRVVRAQ